MGRKKIIVIDDVAVNRAILGEAFKKQYDILEAGEGRAGLDLIIPNQNELAAIFLDIIMPGMDGFAVLQELNIRMLIQKVPVFLITTDATDDVVEKAYDYGAVDVIPKPFNMVVIKRRVENMIEFFEAKRAADEDIVHTDQALAMQRLDQQKIMANLVGSICEVIESRQKEGGGHIQHVRAIAQLVGEQFAVLHPEYGLKPETIMAISDATTLHDIGKIFVSDQILQEPIQHGKLSLAEMQIVRDAPTAGLNFLNTIEGVPEPFFTFAKEICRYHMERWDGNGYPEGVSGNKIPLSAQIASIAEVYDVLVSERVYKKAFSHDEAASMIREGKSGVFNPELIKAFDAASAQIKSEVYGL